MATPYGISAPDSTGTTSTTAGLSDSQVSTSVQSSVTPQALSQLNTALALAAGSGSSTATLTSDATGGPQTVAGSGSGIPVFFAGSNAPTSLQLSGSGAQIVVGGASDLTVFGSNAPQTIIGGTGPNLLSAGTAGGNHLLVAGSGFSTLIGGAGEDTLIGGLYSTSHDTLTAGTGLHQQLTVTAGNNGVFANADTAHAGISDTLVGGTSGSDVLTGSTSKDHTYYSVGFGSSSTTVTGGAGKDTILLNAGSGLTSIDGGGGQNNVTFLGATHGDAVIKTNENTGVTKIEFAGSSQEVKLTNVSTITFENGHTFKI